MTHALVRVADLVGAEAESLVWQPNFRSCAVHPEVDNEHGRPLRGDPARRGDPTNSM